MATGEELLAMAGMGDEKGNSPSEESDEATEYTPTAGEIAAAEEAGVKDPEAFARAVCMIIDMHKAMKD